MNTILKAIKMLNFVSSTLTEISAIEFKNAQNIDFFLCLFMTSKIKMHSQKHILCKQKNSIEIEIIKKINRRPEITNK